MVKKDFELKHILTDDKGILEYLVKTKVKKIGNAGHVILPKELINQPVEVHFKRNNVTPKEIIDAHFGEEN